jgi:hypothetical protein
MLCAKVGDLEVSGEIVPSIAQGKPDADFGLSGSQRWRLWLGRKVEKIVCDSRSVFDCEYHYISFLLVVNRNNPVECIY